MKKITLHLLLIALIGTGAAWVNKPPKTGKHGKFVIHKYSFKSKSSDGTKYYYQYDLTALGWHEGTNYDCLTPTTATCAFSADPNNGNADAGGTYFLYNDILSTSFEPGTFTLD